MKNKKWIALILVIGIILTTPSIAWAYRPAYTLPTLTGNQAEDIVAIAKSQVGYSETSDGGTVYGAWWGKETNLGDYTTVSWCAVFANWCANQAGFGMNEAYDRNSAKADSLFSFLKKNCKYDTSFKSNPQPGDYIFFANSSGTVGHVAIVIGYDASTKKVTFIGGNQGNDEVKQSSCTWKANSSWGSQKVYGYVRLNFEDNSYQPVFEDVYENDWFVEEVEYVYENGIMSGDGGKFMPYEQMTRAMMVTTLYRLMEKPSVEDYTATSAFSDVEAGSWYEDAVNWAYNEDVTTGYPDRMLFGSYESVTREQLAVFLYRYANLQGFDVSAQTELTGYVGVDSISEYAKEGMSWAVATGLITGIEIEENGTTVYDLAPQGSATRAELATILMRYCEYYGI